MSLAGAPLVLASASPRRSEILSRLGMGHEVVPSDLDESALPGETSVAHVERLAVEKGRGVAVRRPDAWVLAGDTVVILKGRILGKPATWEEAVEMLLALAGRAHTVATGLSLHAPGGGRCWSGVEVTRVRFRDFDGATARAYVETGEPMDKAGGYGIQGLGGALVSGIEGDYTNVVGLPIPLLLRLMAEAGVPYRFPGTPVRVR